MTNDLVAFNYCSALSLTLYNVCKNDNCVEFLLEIRTLK